MVSRSQISAILDDYEDITIATVCSHSSLQIFHGARQEGFRSLGIAVGSQPRYYDAFPLAKPDEFLVVDSYKDIPDHADQLVAKNVITVPHGSFVEYLGADRFAKMAVPTFGNREVLKWETDREKQREWLTSAGVDMPRKIERPQDIDRPVFVKYYGAKGGRGAFVAKNEEEFKSSIRPGMKYTIQEYIIGTRYYMHYFYSPIVEKGYCVSKGSLEMLGIDRRDEANIDEMYKLGAPEPSPALDIYPTFVRHRDKAVVLRESLLPAALPLGERVVERSLDLFGGMIGPFCLATIVQDDLKFRVFQISSRIVAGGHPLGPGRPHPPPPRAPRSTGRGRPRGSQRAREGGRPRAARS